MRLAVYPGSFDPITLGHLDVLQRAGRLFDQIIVAVVENPDKQPLFSVAERVQFISSATQHMANVRVDRFQGLLVTFVTAQGADVIIRGLRDTGDLENEMKMAHMNRQLAPTPVTIFIPTDPKYSFVSSSLVKQVARYGGDITSFVTTDVAEALNRRFQATASEE